VEIAGYITVFILIVVIGAIIGLKLTKRAEIKCANCDKEIGKNNENCPYFGEKLRPNEIKQETPSEIKQKPLVELTEESLSIHKIVSLFLLWILISGLLSGLFFLIDSNDGTFTNIYRYEYFQPFDKMLPRKVGTSEYAWAPEASIAVSIIGFNLVGARAGRYYFRRHKRDVYRWTAAFMLFSPIIAGIIYYYTLTWHKEASIELEE